MGARGGFVDIKGRPTFKGRSSTCFNQHKTFVKISMFAALCHH